MWDVIILILGHWLSVNSYDIQLFAPNAQVEILVHFGHRLRRWPLCFLFCLNDACL